MHYSTDNNVPQESELPKWSSRACANVEIKESGEHCMMKGMKSKIPKNFEKMMSIRLLASFWQMLEKAYAQDNAKTVAELMAEVEESIAQEGYNVHEVLNNAK